jgi:hypothetical protein
MYRNVKLLLILLLFLVIGCDEDRIFQHDSGFTVDLFPNEIGLEWQYERTDSLHNIVDTVTVRIIDSIGHTSSLEGTVWNYHFSVTDNVETWLVVQVDDTITFYKDVGVDTVIDYRLVFPMELGDTWDGENYQFITDSFEVVDVSPIPYEMYPAIMPYIVERYLWGLNHYGFSTYSFIPGIGMVEGYFSEILFNRIQNEHWRLIDFSNFIPPQGSFNLSEFPSSDGMWWDYQVQNNLIDCDCFDTLHVAVAESATIALWTYEYPSYTYQEYTDIRNDTLLYFYFNQIGQPYKGLVFPIELGNSWSVFHPFDTSTVNGYEFVLLPNGMTYDAYHIRTRLICGDECERIEDVWIVSDIGIVKKRILEIDYNIYGGGIISDEIWYMFNYFGS